MNTMSRRTGALAAVAALVAAAVGFVVLAPGILFADPPLTFPGLESGARDAASHGLAANPNASSSNNGLTLALVGIVADDTQTVVSYALKGRESEGNTAFGVSPPMLVDADGQTYRMLRGSVDQANRRLGTWVFPPIPAEGGTLAVVVEGFELGTPRQGAPTTITNVPGTWRVEFQWDGNKAPPGPQVAVPAASQAFGRGSMSISSVQQSATATLVSGTLDGFPAEVIQSMDCPAAELETAAGNPVKWIACRLGFGEGYRSFEINYPPTSGRVKVNFVLSFTGHGPPGFTLPADFKATDGAKATFELDLPAR